MHITTQFPVMSDITADNTHILPDMIKLDDMTEDPGLRHARMLEQISGMYSSIFGSKSGPDRYDILRSIDIHYLKCSEKSILLCFFQMAPANLARSQVRCPPWGILHLFFQVNM